jgi:hypothetical protein
MKVAAISPADSGFLASRSASRTIFGNSPVWKYPVRL